MQALPPYSHMDAITMAYAGAKSTFQYSDSLAALLASSHPSQGMD